MKTQNRVNTVFLYLTVFLSGGVVMIVELLGTKILAPFFGTSIYSWTAVIAVTLTALSAGYYYGGRAADKDKQSSEQPQRKGQRLYRLILTAGVFLAVLPLFQMPVLKFCSGMGIRGGALAASVIFFGYPMFALGTVMPQVLNLAFQEESRLGNTVGVLWAVSTAGSLLGTLLTGFFLIPSFGKRQILLGCAAALIILAGIYFIKHRMLKQAVVCLVFICLVVASVLIYKDRTQVETAENVWKLVDKLHSYYGSLSVIDRYLKSDSLPSVPAKSVQRGLFNDGLCQGYIYSESGKSSAEYTYGLNALIDIFAPSPRDVLVLGVGPGLLPMHYARKGSRVDAVDISSRMVKLAAEYFGYGAPNLTSHIMDGRVFLSRTQKKYDAVIMDALLGGAVPAHFLTLEMFKEVKSHLNPNGVVVANFLAQRNPEGLKAVHALLSTMAEVFRVSGAVARDTTELVNCYLFASNVTPSRGADLTDVPAYFKPKIVNVFANPISFKPNKDMVLTDNYNPMEILNLSNREAARKNVLQLENMALLYL